MRTIDADDAIKRIRKLWNKGEPLEEAWEHDDYAFGLSDAIDAVDDSPTIEPKHGEWMYIDDDDPLYDSYRCTVCGKVFTVDFERRDDIGFVIEDLDFCPNCGARMKGADDE